MRVLRPRVVISVGGTYLGRHIMRSEALKHPRRPKEQVDSFTGDRSPWCRLLVVSADGGREGM